MKIICSIERARRSFGAICCGVSVALGAYASHGVDGENAKRLAIAAVFAFAHGLALWLAPCDSRWFAKGGHIAFAVGIVMFSGSLIAAVTFSLPTTLAPIGGVLLMFGWLIAAIAALTAIDRDNRC